MVCVVLGYAFIPSLAMKLSTSSVSVDSCLACTFLQRGVDTVYRSVCAGPPWHARDEPHWILASGHSGAAASLRLCPSRTLVIKGMSPARQSQAGTAVRGDASFMTAVVPHLTPMTAGKAFQPRFLLHMTWMLELTSQG